MTPAQLKQKVKEAFENVDSSGFLEKQVKKGVEKQRENYRLYKEYHPDGDFATWKHRNETEINYNATDSNDVMAIGIFLLSLDEFEKELEL